MTTSLKNVRVPLNLMLPQWALDALNEEAGRTGVQMQDLIRFWLIEKLDTVSVPLPR